MSTVAFACCECDATFKNRSEARRHRRSTEHEFEMGCLQ